MNYSEFKKGMREDVMLFKDGYEHVPFSTDEGSKAHQYFKKVFEKLGSEKSTNKREQTNIGDKIIFYLHKDDLTKIMYCLGKIYEKTRDKEIIDWVNDIKYHFLHYKKNP